MKSSTLEIGAAYIRVSTDDQAELSPDAQIRVIRDAAKAEGFIIPEEFIFMEKRGISGRKADNRPEFQRMVAVAKSQSPAPFKRLYVWKFSRFARNQEESIFYKGILRKKCQVEIKSVSEPIAEGMFGRLIETIIEWFDEYYSINLSGEVLRGMSEKALRSGYQISPCLGYRAVGGGRPYVIDDREYPIVEFIFSYYHEGHDLTAVARECNRRGYRTRRGNLFERRTIDRILRNRFYMGIVEWNGIQFQGTHETRPSVTDIFQANLDRLAQEFHPVKRREISSCRHWLSGILVCGSCGASLSVNVSNNQKKRPDAFQCWKYAKGYHTGSCSISVHKAEASVLESLKSVLDTGNIEFEYIKPMDKTLSGERAALEAALFRLTAKEARIRDAYENGIDSLDEYRVSKERLKTERTALDQELANLFSQDPEVPLSVQKSTIMESIRSAYNLISNPDVSYEIKGAALRRIVKKIIYYRSENRLEFHYYV
ncbi:MAG: recombinase family protein [Hungatella sp.]|jgi:DNA invertase Pin-like site-specific DNA recombinase|nr:recombinase family protein [Hungatella sp.]